MSRILLTFIYINFIVNFVKFFIIGFSLLPFFIIAVKVLAVRPSSKTFVSKLAFFGMSKWASFGVITFVSFKELLADQLWMLIKTILSFLAESFVTKFGFCIQFA